MKTNKALFVLILATVSLTAWCQETKKGLINLSLGASVPNDAFSNSVLYTHTSRFAETGFHSSINLNYKFNNFMGFSALVMYNSYPADKTVNSETTHFILENWNSTSFFSGPFFYFEFKKLELSFKTLLGFAYTNQPEVSKTYTDPSLVGVLILDTPYEMDGTSFAYLLGPSITYPISKRFAASLNIDYFYTKSFLQSDKLVQTESSGGINSFFGGSYEYPSNIQKISTINLSLSLGYRF